MGVNARRKDNVRRNSKTCEEVKVERGVFVIGRQTIDARYR